MGLKLLDINSNICYFCQSILHEFCGEYSCRNKNCNYKYYLARQFNKNINCISYTINNIQFRYYYHEDLKPKFMVILNRKNNIRFTHSRHILVNEDNYQQVIDRIIGLQAFK